MKTISIFLVLSILAAGCSTLPKPIETPLDSGTSRPNPVFITNHGWHTGIIFPRSRLVNAIHELANRFPAGKYLEIGWGDRGFYQANEITTAITLQAVFQPTDSVVHVVSVPEGPYGSFPNSEIRKLCLSDSAMNAMEAFIVSSFRRDTSAKIEATRKGIYGDSQFYVGVGSYHLFNTCNKWTAKGLKSAGYRIDPTFKLTASSVIDAIDAEEKINRRSYDRLTELYVCR